MGARASEARIYQIPAQYIMNELQSVQFCQFQKLQFLNMTPSSAGATFWYRRGMTMTSWGERICVIVAAVGPYATQVTIHSECEYAAQIADWGQNRNNVVSIFLHLERFVMKSTGPAPAQTRLCPHCQKTVAASSRFCKFCGYPI
jgi:hypothetical protein